MYFDSHDLLELEDYLKLHNIPKDKVCLVGSTTLSLIGVRKHNDIDFVLHSSCQYCKLSDHMFIERVKSPWSTLFSDDQLIENTDLHILNNKMQQIYECKEICKTFKEMKTYENGGGGQGANVHKLHHLV